mgnify:CR=1 FL=1
MVDFYNSGSLQQSLQKGVLVQMQMRVMKVTGMMQGLVRSEDGLKEVVEKMESLLERDRKIFDESNTNKIVYDNNNEFGEIK